MKGIVVKKAYDGNKWLIIRGEDGVEYFARLSSLVDQKQYTRYGWKGNLAVFDKDDSEDFRIPHAKNVILARVADPDREKKRLRWIENEKARLEKEERRRVNRDKQELTMARARQRKEYEAKNTWYEVQRFTDDGWETVLHAGLPARHMDIAEARKKIADLKREFPGTRYRFVKHIGLVMSVRSGSGGRRPRSDSDKGKETYTKRYAESQKAREVCADEEKSE